MGCVKLGEIIAFRCLLWENKTQINYPISRNPWEVLFSTPVATYCPGRMAEPPKSKSTEQKVLTILMGHPVSLQEILPLPPRGSTAIQYPHNDDGRKKSLLMERERYHGIRQRSTQCGKSSESFWGLSTFQFVCTKHNCRS